MPTYKLTYFNIAGLGEPIRLILSYMGVDFEDNRISFKDWPALKPTTPYGVVPVLEIDGKKVVQSAAICRYLGKEAKLCGANNWDELQIDITVDTITDFRMGMIGFAKEENPELKKKKKETFLKETLPFYISKFDEQVKTNGGFFVGGKLSWADLYWIGFSETAEEIIQDEFISKYPNLKKLRETVLALPQIKKWMQKRPPSEELPFKK